MSTISNRLESSTEPGAEGDLSNADAVMAPGSPESSSSQGQLGARAGEPPAERNQQRRPTAPTRWAWNLPLLLATVVVLIIGVPVLVGLYYWQSARIGGQLLQLADRAVADGKPQEEVQWLRRYLALQPEDVDAQVRMARTFDDNVRRWAQLDQSRRHLLAAVTAVDSRDDEVEDDLRRRLIHRLVQLGGGWLLEAERQIVKLNPPEQDAEALALMAKSLWGQLNAEAARPAVTDVPEREVHYWRWLAAQPVGDVLRLAAEANPDSVELSVAFLNAALNRPELFTADATQKASLRDQAQQLIADLSKRNDNGHAQWIAFAYAGRADISVETQPLAVASAAALERLKAHAATFEPVEYDELALQLGQPHAYVPYWDAQLVLAHAGNLAAGQALDAAREHYQSLVSLPQGMLPYAQVERSYLGAGQTFWQIGDREAARQMWTAGNEQLGGANLALLEALATSSTQFGTVAEARKELDRFAAAIDAASLRLAGERRTMSPDQRNALQKQLDTATWRIDVFRAHLDFKDRNFARAAQRLERSLASQLDIDTTMRVEASELLASAYGEQGLWDLAARVLDAAAVLDPKNRLLQQRAAAAWQSASASSRAAEQWQRADDGSFSAALAYAGAVAASLGDKSPAQRDYKTLVQAIHTAQQRLDGLIAAGEAAPADAWRLAMLRLALPAAQRRPSVPATAASGTSSPSETDLTPESQELIALSREFPHAALLQATAALALERAGDSAAADEAVERLLAIEDVEPLLVAEVRARLAVERETPEVAAKLLFQAYEDNTDDRLRIAKFAAEFLRTFSRPGDSIALLMKVPAAEHDPQSLLMLGELLLSVQQSSSRGDNRDLQAAPAQMDVAAELQKVEDALRNLEGDGGTHWRLLAAERLLQTTGGEAAQRRTRLGQAGVLQSEIVSRRPRWSRALALGGRIAAEQGDARKAVELLRRAISEGDRSSTTVLQLVQQLNQIGEFAAAEQELARLENWTDSVGQISMMSVGLSLAQGKNESALERARSGIAVRPKDAGAYVVLAQAAAAIARVDAEQSDELHAEAEKALQRAQQLTGGRDLSVWQAQFRYQSEVHGRSAGRAVLNALQQSALPEGVRSLALGNGYLSLGDWEEARSWLAKAKQAAPADLSVSLAQVALCRATNDNEGLLLALEDAHRLSPDRPEIRRQLAIALASQASGEEQWERIRSLTGTDRPGASESDRLYHALLLISRAEPQYIEQARTVLDEIRQSSDQAVADDAVRMLLGLERSRWATASKQGNSADADAALEAMQQLYESLVNRSQPNPIDLYGYGGHLLQVGKGTEAKAVAARLHGLAPAGRGTLDLRLRTAKETGSENDVPGIVEAWLKNQEGGKTSEAYAAVGQVMVSNGLVKQAVEILRSAYQADSAQLRNYVVALAKADAYERAIQVCIDRFESSRSPEAVALLADVIVEGLRPDLVNNKIDSLFDAVAQEFPMNLKLIEAIATLRLSQQRYTDAAQLFAQSEKLSSVSLVTLNNMAVALAEIPGRQADALQRIDRAIDLYGRDPELLDTLGIVQLRAGQFRAAEATLREAYTKSNESRHLFHLLLVFEASKQSDELKQWWSKMDLTRLKTGLLTPDERRQLEEFQNQFGTPRTL